MTSSRSSPEKITTKFWLKSLTSIEKIKSLNKFIALPSVVSESVIENTEIGANRNHVSSNLILLGRNPMRFSSQTIHIDGAFVAKFVRNMKDRAIYIDK